MATPSGIVTAGGFWGNGRWDVMRLSNHFQNADSGPSVNLFGHEACSRSKYWSGSGSLKHRNSTTRCTLAFTQDCRFRKFMEQRYERGRVEGDRSYESLHDTMDGFELSMAMLT